MGSVYAHLNTHPVPFVPTVVHSGWRAVVCVEGSVFNCVRDCEVQRKHSGRWFRIWRDLESLSSAWCSVHLVALGYQQDVDG